MKSFLILTITFGLCFIVYAQTDDESESNILHTADVQKAIDEFNRLKKEGKPNEISVILDPVEPEDDLTEPEAEPAEPETDPAEQEVPRAIAVEELDIPEALTEEIPEKKTPVLVSGKPPEVTKIEESENTLEITEEIDPVKPIVEEPQGLNVRVESIRSGNGEIDSKKVSLKESFPVKSLSEAPAGWKFELSDSPPPFTREVELKSGTFISLKIVPHVLSPASDGANVFSVSEPGYSPEFGYQQKNTVEAILEKSVSQLDTDAIKMGNALSDLHRLLASLPKPEVVSSEETSDKP